MANKLAISGSESAEELDAKIDSGDSFTVDARAVTRLVSRYLADELSAAELAQIGDRLESGEFIEYVGPGADGIIAQVLFEMSSPEAHGPITKEAAERWLRLLGD
jgi:hypothetical protein